MTDHTLPGITFEVVPPKLPDTLPRMDVAGFVGFASAGPVDVPVVVDDVVSFRDVFGPDVRLARDLRSGGWAHGHLGAAVEEFLRNGGRRCWVVRVAAPEAESARFPAAGLLGAVDGAGAIRSAELVARSVGDWADGLRVATELRTKRLPPVEVAPGRPRLRIPARVPLRSGDLLRVTVDGGASSELLVVAEVTTATDGSTHLRWDGRMTLHGDPDDRSVAGDATLVTVHGEQPLGAAAAEATGEVGLRVLDLSPETVPAGAVVRIRVGNSSLVAPVVGPAPGAGGTLIGPCTTIVGDPIVPAHVVGGEHATDVPGLDVDDASGSVVERVTLSLAVYDDERLIARIDGLTFDARHPDHWGSLPDDQRLFRRRALSAGADGRGPRPAGSEDTRMPELWRRVGSPRFPLAAPAEAPGVWFPVGVADLAHPDAALATSSSTAPEDRRRRSGLASFDATVFTDRGLRDVPPEGLGPAVDARANLSNPPRLRGVHGLFPLDEVTLVAVPDACHPDWELTVEARPLPPEAPVLRDLEHRGGQMLVRWSAVDGVGRYVVEEAATLDLATPLVRLDGPPPIDDDGPELHLPSGACRTLRALRVRAVGDDGRTSPWSNTVHTIDPPTTFSQVDDQPLPAPIVTLQGHEDGDRLLWTEPDELGLSADVRVEVVRSSHPLFVTADRVDPAGADHLELPPTAEQHVFLRVRYLDGGTVGPWSTTVVQPAQDREVMEVVPPVDGAVSDALLGVQRALLRFAAGRGDVLGVLSLPAGYLEEATLSHLSHLRGAGVAGVQPGGLPPRAPLDERVLQHAAVFAPWTSVRTSAGVRAVPPDGAISGVMADRAIERGAWISPSNQPLAGVVALGSDLAAADRNALAAAGVNLLLRRPNGVVATSAATLGDDPVTRPVEVRRLLHLLRRLAVRHGATYVFEPNGHRFRSKVRRTFQRVLGGLFERGAFAGTHPEEGFQIVADHTVNPPGALNAGRFVVELRVAPTQPMVFVRVRLVQTGPGDAVTVEVVS